MPEVSTFRLYLLRATYLLIFVGLAIEIWPLLLHRGGQPELMRGVVRCVLATVSLLAALGIRYPLKMLPLLFFELIWKTIWLLAYGIPVWSSQQVDPGTRETIKACLMGVILVPLVLSWRHVFANYVKAPGDRWR